jgi:hypothetical protein
MTVNIFGKRNAYKVEDPVGTLEKIAKKLRESEDSPEYNTEQMEKFLEKIAEAFRIQRMDIYLKNNIKEK